MLSTILADDRVDEQDLAGQSSPTSRYQPEQQQFDYRFAHQAAPLTGVDFERARRRSALPIDQIMFSASCPACGVDREWTQTRDNTRLISSIGCDCGPDGAPSQR
jgi:hypothetical protein